jgi:hypothetical protein
VQPSQAEKNRAGQMAKAGALAAAMASSAPGPMKLYVGSLHFNITEEMLRGIFEPFGRIDEILLMKDHETGRSKGFGFITVSTTLVHFFRIFVYFGIFVNFSSKKGKTPKEHWNSSMDLK